MTDAVRLKYINGRFIQVDKIDAITELQVTHARLSIATDALHMIQSSTRADVEELKTYARRAIEKLERTHNVAEGTDAEAQGEAGQPVDEGAEHAVGRPEAEEAEETEEAEDEGEAP